jgi:hypothetical protein
MNLMAQNKLIAVGFEPTPPERLVPKTSALDHSATLPHDIEVTFSSTNLTGLEISCNRPRDLRKVHAKVSEVQTVANDESLKDELGYLWRDSNPQSPT